MHRFTLADWLATHLARRSLSHSTGGRPRSQPPSRAARAGRIIRAHFCGPVCQGSNRALNKGSCYLLVCVLDFTHIIYTLQPLRLLGSVSEPLLTVGSAALAPTIGTLVTEFIVSKNISPILRKSLLITN